MSLGQHCLQILAIVVGLASGCNAAQPEDPGSSGKDPDNRQIIFSWRPPGQKANKGYGWTQLWMADAEGKSRSLIYGEDGRHVYGGHHSWDCHNRFVFVTVFWMHKPPALTKTPDFARIHIKRSKRETADSRPSSRPTRSIPGRSSDRRALFYSNLWSSRRNIDLSWQ